MIAKITGVAVLVFYMSKVTVSVVRSFLEYTEET